MNELTIKDISWKEIEDNLIFNIIFDSDSYKTTQWLQDPPDVEEVVSYIESRGGQFDENVFFGAQYIQSRYLTGKVITHRMIDVAKVLIVAHMGGIPKYFNEVGWRDIVDRLGGILPIEIKSLPEGVRVKKKNVLMTVRNTDKNCVWLVSYLETMLLRVWYPISVATLSWELRKVIMSYLEKNGTPENISFMLQDFGSRGASSRETAQIGAMSHAVVFKGSDTMIALGTILKFYGMVDCPFYSVPASEHSTTTSWLRTGESKFTENMLKQFKKGIVSIVIDSYDDVNFIKNIIGKDLKVKVMSRDGVTVLRLDSGDIVTGVLRTLQLLSDIFGYSMNDKGYMVLPNFIRILQGDGMNYHTVRALFRALDDAGWSADNMACVGMGGKLLQSTDRDTHKMAFKRLAARTSDGIWYDVYKDPVTDTGKRSKRGRHAVQYINDEFISVRIPDNNVGDYFGDRLVTTFLNGYMVTTYSFEDVRENLLAENYRVRIYGANDPKE